MYSTGGVLPVERVSGGTTLLVSGPPMTHKQDLVLSTLAVDDDEKTGTVIVTTDDSPSAIWEQYCDRAGEADPSRVGIVNATGREAPAASGPTGATEENDDAFEADGAGRPAIATVGSPSDLTGVGMKLSQLFRELVTERGVTRLRLAICNLSTMAMYADGDALVKFVHALTNRIDEVDGLAFAVVHSDAMDETVVQQLYSFVDGSVETRQRDHDAEGDEPIAVRVRGLSGETDWIPANPAHAARPARATPASGAGETVPASSGSATPADVATPESLSAAIDAVASERPTLTVCNYDSGQERLADLRTYFEEHNVAVREATLDVERPRNVALLHREDTLLGSAGLEALDDVIAVADDSMFETHGRPALLDRLATGDHGVDGVDKSFLIDVSHVFEVTGYRTGAGTLHAGFQRLSRLWTDPRTRGIYERLVEAGVDVHVYGLDDGAMPDDTGVTVHTSSADEILKSWFVVFDGAGRDDRKGTLLVQEREPETYDGFWTRDPDRTDAIAAYLAETY